MYYVEKFTMETLLTLSTLGQPCSIRYNPLRLSFKSPTKRIGMTHASPFKSYPSSSIKTCLKLYILNINLFIQDFTHTFLP